MKRSDTWTMLITAVMLAGVALVLLWAWFAG